jgi:DivIVA domain-containing protein
MAAELVEDVSELRPALDDREFSIARKGYDREEVRAFLAEIEANLRQLEEWAERTKARLALAEDKSAAIGDVDQAMLAVFDAKERVLKRAQLQAGRIEAEATERARIDAEIVAAGVIAEARDEAHRIIETTLSATTPATEESVLAAARAQAERLILDARGLADRLIEDARAEAGTPGTLEATGTSPEPSPVAYDRSVGSGSVSRLLVEMQGVAVDGPPGEARQAHDAEEFFILDRGGNEEVRRSRYQRTSAGLPSIGDDASAVFASMRRLRKKFRKP